MLIFGRAILDVPCSPFLKHPETHNAITLFAMHVGERVRNPCEKQVYRGSKSFVQVFVILISEQAVTFTPIRSFSNNVPPIIIAQSLGCYTLPETNQPQKHKDKYYFAIVWQSCYKDIFLAINKEGYMLTCSQAKNFKLTSDSIKGSLSTGHRRGPFSLQLKGKE